MAADAELTQLISQVKVEGNFDQTDDVVLNWLSRRHQLMCSRSKCLRRAGEVTIPDQATLDTVTASDGFTFGEDPSFIELDEFSVNGAPYTKITLAEYIGLAAGTLTLRGTGGVYAHSEDVQGLTVARIWPRLAIGDTLYFRYAATPEPLDAFTVPTPPEPSLLKISREFQDALVAGAIATGLARTEQRPDLAAPYESQFDAACEELRRQVNRKYRGSQPATIRVVGYDA